ncbi:MAG: hypothetical protein PHG61_03660 [Candidatus Marinimicrobia bacterium]|nr:hypothetical protein [Candidatus Neomarinimicrobiota bacterium]
MGTYGEYVKTKEAQKEANREIRSFIKLYTDDGKRKLVKMKMGKPGTLNYGRAVMWFEAKVHPLLLKVNPKRKPVVLIAAVNYSLVARAVSHKVKNLDQWVYSSHAAAKKRYDSEVRKMSY